MNNNVRFLLFFAITVGLVMFFEYRKQSRNASDLAEVPLVKAPAGIISGTKAVSRDGRTIFSYKGIPYAKPPVGSLRFARPQPLERPFKEVFEATSYGSMCPQPFKPTGGLTGEEDCLYLNVFVPKRKGKIDQPLPVMFWIHGGGYGGGDGTDMVYGPGYLLDRDVILVTTHYRVGPLGFLNLGTEKLSGNQGMWDVRQALLWVQENVAAFGGDPGQVTLFGESAGSMSVFYLLLSQKNEGLFHAAIPMSGDIFTPFLGLDRSRPMPDFHKKYVKEVGCDISSSDETLDCLQKLPLGSVMKDMFMFDDCNFLTGSFPVPTAWKPSSDFKYSSDPLFADDPIRLMQDGKTFGKIPIMAGFNKEEGLITTVTIIGEEDNKKKLATDWDRCMTYNLLAKRFDDITKDDINLWKRLEEFYFPGEAKHEVDNSGNDIFKNLTDSFTDFYFAIGNEKTMRSLISTQHDVFFYHFDHLGSFSMADVFGKSPFQLIKTIASKTLGFHDSLKMGTCHADDLLYIFSSSLPFKWLPDPADEVMSRLMVDLWTNFAIYKNPTPKDPETGHFIGSSLKHLHNQWEKSTIRNDGLVEYVILKDGDIHFERNPEADNRLLFLMRNIDNAIKYYANQK